MDRPQLRDQKVPVSTLQANSVRSTRDLQLGAIRRDGRRCRYHPQLHRTIAVNQMDAPVIATSPVALIRVECHDSIGPNFEVGDGRRQGGDRVDLSCRGRSSGRKRGHGPGSR